MMTGTRNSSLDAVERVQEALRKAGFECAVVRTEDTIFTVEDAARTVGAPPEEILKSILLLVDDRPVLALMSGVNRVDLKKVRVLCGAKKVKMWDAESVFAWSGFRVGGVPPVGYPEQIAAFLDEDLYAHRVVWAAAGSDHAFFPVSPEDLQRLTSGKRSDIRKTAA